MESHFITRNKSRYGDFGAEWGDLIQVFGSKDKAEKLAAHLTDHHAGCDWLFYVEEDPFWDE